MWKYHAPCPVRHASPEFAVDEISHAPEKQAERHRGRDKIRQVQPVDAVLVAIPEFSHHHTDQSAMEGHAPLRNFQHTPPGDAIREFHEQMWRVKQAIAQATAE